MNVVDRGAILYTDKWSGYNGVDKLYKHMSINHGNNEYVNGRIYTNTIENFWGLLKRGLLGIYHRISSKHLQRYIDEFVFRYNTRNETEFCRFNVLLANTGVRLRYDELVWDDIDKIFGHH